MYAILLIVAVVVCAVQSQPLYGIPIGKLRGSYYDYLKVRGYILHQSRKYRLC